MGGRARDSHLRRCSSPLCLLVRGSPHLTSSASLQVRHMDTLEIEPRASRMQSGCDTATPCAQMMGLNSALLPAVAVILPPLLQPPRRVGNGDTHPEPASNAHIPPNPASTKYTHPKPASTKYTHPNAASTKYTHPKVTTPPRDRNTYPRHRR